MRDARPALIKLGDEFVAVAMTVARAWALTKQEMDPLTLERFALNCLTAAQALTQLAERTREYAGDLLDGDD